MSASWKAIRGWGAECTPAAADCQPQCDGIHLAARSGWVNGKIPRLPQPPEPKGLVPIFRKTRLALSEYAAAGAAARLLRVPVGLCPRRAALHRRHDRTHGGNWGIRGPVVQHVGPRRRLARQGRAVAAVDGTAR